MKKTLLITGAAIGLGLFCSPANASVSGGKESKVRKALSAANRKTAAMNADAVARFYHPAAITSEEYNSEEEAWGEPYTINFTYNPAGQVLTRSHAGSLTKYTYDEAGRLIKQEDFQTADGSETGDYKLTHAVEYTYDTVVKNLVVREVSTSYDSMTGEESSSASGVEITRNSDGNITKIQDYSEWGGEKWYGEALVIEYGDDKKAVKITEWDDDEVYLTISDIVWDTTDGQITTYEYDDPNGDMYFSSNRIASATIIDDHYPSPGKFTAEYDGDSYHSKIMVDDVRALEIDFKCIQKFADREDFDEQYSYDCTSFESEFEYEEETDSYYVECTRDRIEENRADAFGINIYNKSVTTYKYPSPQHKYDDEVEIDESKYDVTYDETFGYPLVAVHSYIPYDSDELKLSSRYTYSGYENVDPAGIGTPAVETSVETEYFNLQGVRVSLPLTPGIYLCKKGEKVSKVAIR
ncbi:MAG: hypothetical protein HDS43_07010 [Bacteroides sp.]|nr:hypothetical protein [Bacteroides sp.]